MTTRAFSALSFTPRRTAAARLAVALLAIVAATAPDAGAAPVKPDFVRTAWSLSGPVKVSVSRLGRVSQPRRAILFFDDAEKATLDVADEGVYEFTWIVVGRKANRVTFTYEPGSDTAFNNRLAATIESVAAEKRGLNVNDIVVTPVRTKLTAVLNVKRNRIKLKGLRTFTGRSDALNRSFRGKYKVKGSGGPASS